MSKKSGIGAIKDWLFSRLAERWFELMLGFITGGGMGYLAAITDWMAPWGPIGWAATGFFFLAVVISFYALYWWARSRRDLTEFSEKAAQSISINVLEDLFVKKKINLSDFYHPFLRATKHAKFQDCELFGPCSIVLDGGKIERSNFHYCDVVIVGKKSEGARGIAKFDFCIFERCDFFRVTFFMTKAQYLDLERDIGAKGVNIISDGSLGDG